eukprot:10027948-Lingulodinium_polyedra.AAC.1
MGPRASSGSTSVRGASRVRCGGERWRGGRALLVGPLPHDRRARGRSSGLDEEGVPEGRHQVVPRT